MWELAQSLEAADMGAEGVAVEVTVWDHLVEVLQTV